MVAWRARYAERGLAGLEDTPRSGRPPLVDDAKRYAILSKTLTPPPPELGITHWSFSFPQRSPTGKSVCSSTS